MEPEQSEGKKPEDGEDEGERREILPCYVLNMYSYGDENGECRTEDDEFISHLIELYLITMKTLVTVLIVAILAWAVYAFVANDEPEAAAPVQNQEEAGGAAALAPNVREFVVTGQNFSFAPANLRVSRGDRVRIVFQNSGGTHDWVIDQFNARTKVLSEGQSETIEFTADTTGSFEYYCSIGTHRQMGMKGTLVVE